eukprot:8465507-Prorocentrum_lima.AAC.1
MTSSLVGSEMCIRDRPSMCLLLLEEDPAPASQQFELQDQHKCNEDAVSYTHLTLPTICSV